MMRRALDWIITNIWIPYRFYLVNGLWLSGLFLLFFFFWEHRFFLLSNVLASIIGRIEEIGDHRGWIDPEGTEDRRSWSWLPPWFWEKVKGRLVDGYHISRRLSLDLHKLSFVFLTLSFIQVVLNSGAVWVFVPMYVLLWMYDGLTENLWYHVNWMRPQYREYDMILHYWNKNAGRSPRILRETQRETTS